METFAPPDASLGVVLFVTCWLISLTLLGVAVVLAWLIARQLQQRFWVRMALALTLLFVQTIMNAIYVTHITPVVGAVEWDWFLFVYYGPRITTDLLLCWALGGVHADLQARDAQTAPEQTATAERLRQLEYLLPHLDRTARALLRKPEDDAARRR
jgi:hypothetical protein